MLDYGITATFRLGTNVKPEAGLEKEVRAVIREIIEQEGIDEFLDTLDYGDVTVKELSDEEVDAAFENDDFKVSLEGFKEMLTAVSLGLLEVEGISKEKAIEALENLSKEGL